MSDPLRLLREFNIKNKEVTERDEKLYFGDYCWPKNHKTKYEIKIKGETDKEYYTLECLHFFLKNRELNHPDYCKLATEAKVPAVRRPDRKDLLAYLNGETEAFGPKVIPQATGRKRPAQGVQSIAKKNKRR